MIIENMYKTVNLLTTHRIVQNLSRMQDNVKIPTLPMLPKCCIAAQRKWQTVGLHRLYLFCFYF